MSKIQAAGYTLKYKFIKIKQDYKDVWRKGILMH